MEILGDDLTAFFFGLARGWEIKMAMVIILGYQPVIEDPQEPRRDEARSVKQYHKMLWYGGDFELEFSPSIILDYVLARLLAN